MIWVMVVVSFLFLSTLVAFILTALSDPGILPRNAEPTIMMERVFDTQQVVLPGVRPTGLKFCDTCRIHRPPRCSHCNLCGNCVEMLDHHCVWVGTCIGKRNYRSYCFFLCFSSIYGTFVAALCIYHLYLLTKEFQTRGYQSAPAFQEVLIRNPVSFILAIYCAFSMWFILGLCGYHSYLIWTGQTTHEQLKKAFPFDNPHSQGVLGNCFRVFCAPMIRSNIQSSLDETPASTAVVAPIRYLDTHEMHRISIQKEKERSRYSPLRGTVLTNGERREKPDCKDRTMINYERKVER